jgi:hypothetical protein
VQEPIFDHVFVPGEFVETMADKLLDPPATKDETFQVTVVDGAADIGLLAAKLTKEAMRSKTPAERREGEEMFTGET